MSFDPEADPRTRAALVAAIRHAMEATCGYSPAEAELEEAIQAGLVMLREDPIPPRNGGPASGRSADRPHGAGGSAER